jgi:hypothetical protein
MMPRGILAVRGGNRDNGCAIEVDPPLVRIRGDSREAVFDTAAEVVRTLPGSRPLSLSGILHSPARPSGFDRWTIIVGAEVAFSPTALDPHFPRTA